MYAGIRNHAEWIFIMGMVQPYPAACRMFQSKRRLICLRHEKGCPSLQIELAYREVFKVWRCFNGFDRDSLLESWRWCCEERHERVFWSKKTLRVPTTQYSVQQLISAEPPQFLDVFLFQSQKACQNQSCLMIIGYYRGLYYPIYWGTNPNLFESKTRLPHSR